MIRRDWLRLAGGTGLTLLGEVLQRRSACAGPAATREPGFGRAKSVILVVANGGQSQLESWDPKPDAPR